MRTGKKKVLPVTTNDIFAWNSSNKFDYTWSFRWQNYTCCCCVNILPTWAP